MRWLPRGPLRGGIKVQRDIRRRWGGKEGLGGVNGPCDHILEYMSGWLASSQSWHFLMVPPYSQYYLVALVSGWGSRMMLEHSRARRIGGIDGSGAPLAAEYRLRSRNHGSESKSMKVGMMGKTHGG